MPAFNYFVYVGIQDLHVGGKREVFKNNCVLHLFGCWLLFVQPVKRNKKEVKKKRQGLSFFFFFFFFAFFVLKFLACIFVYLVGFFSLSFFLFFFFHPLGSFTAFSSFKKNGFYFLFNILLKGCIY